MAADSARDRATVANVVAQYLRRSSPWTKPPDETRRDARLEQARRLRDRAPAAQAALDVLALEVPPFKVHAERRLNLTFADLRFANLGGARFPIPPDLEGSNLAGAFLDGARLRKARLDGTTMVDTALADTDLREAEVRHAHVDANLNGAKLQDAVLDGSDLRLAKNLENAQLRGAKATRATTWPHGFAPEEHGVVIDDRRR